MSFRCQKCNEVSQRPDRVVVERKTLGFGSQIARELNLCDPCAGKTPVPVIERVAQPIAPLSAPIDFSNVVEHEEV